MSGAPFKWMWGDPADVMDRLRPLRERLAQEEALRKEIRRRKKARRIRHLVKLAMARELKGQRK